MKTDGAAEIGVDGIGVDRDVFAVACIIPDDLNTGGIFRIGIGKTSLAVDDSRICFKNGLRIGNERSFFIFLIA